MLACRASVWLVSRTRCGIALPSKSSHVARELLAGERVLRDRMQVVALQRHEARTLQRDQRLTGGDAVATRDRQARHHAGHRRAHDPQLRCGDHDLGGIGQRRVGRARNRDE